MGEGIRRDIGADHRLPGDDPAHRVVDRRPQECGGRRLAAGDLEVGPHGLEQRLVRLRQDVEEVRDRRPGVAAHVGDARLEDGLGDGQDALAGEDLAGAVAKLLDVLGERAFHGASGAGRMSSIVAYWTGVLEMPTLTATLLWQRLDVPGMEYCRLWAQPDGFRFEGTLIVDEVQPWRVHYEVDCSPAWETRTAVISLTDGEATRELRLAGEGSWLAGL